jgi:hypothetical protein
MESSESAVDVQPNPQLVRHLEKAASQWSQYVNFNTSTAVRAFFTKIEPVYLKLYEVNNIIFK